MISESGVKMSNGSLTPANRSPECSKARRSSRRTKDHLYNALQQRSGLSDRGAILGREWGSTASAGPDILKVLVGANWDAGPLHIPYHDCANVGLRLPCTRGIEDRE